MRRIDKNSFLFRYIAFQLTYIEPRCSMLDDPSRRLSQGKGLYMQTLYVINVADHQPRF